MVRVQRAHARPARAAGAAAEDAHPALVEGSPDEDEPVLVDGSLHFIHSEADFSLMEAALHSIHMAIQKEEEDDDMHGMVAPHGIFYVAHSRVKSVAVVELIKDKMLRPRPEKIGRPEKIVRHHDKDMLQRLDEEYVKRQRRRQYREVLPFISLSGKPVMWGKPVCVQELKVPL